MLRRVYRGPRLPLGLAVLGLAAACNEPPPEPTVSIEPETPLTADDLNAVATPPVDPNDDEVTLSYAWSVDGESRPDLTSATVPAAETAKGQSWTVEVIANDGKEDGPAGSATTTIGNTAPEATVTLTPDVPTSEQALTATAEGTDADDDAVTFSFVWTVDGSVANDLVGPEVPADRTARGQVWEVAVTPSDGTDEGAAVTATVSIDNAPPTVESINLSPDPAFADSEIEATVETADTDGDDVSLSYAWTINGVDAGTDSPTLPAGTFALGDSIVVTVTPNDGTLDGASVTSDPLTIVNGVPSLTGALITPDEATETSTLTCEPQGYYDPDGDSGSFTYTWSVDGTLVAGATSATLTGDSFDRDQVVTCTAVPSDGTDTGAPVTSDGATILNTAPVLDAASIAPASPITSDTLSITPGSVSDADPADTVSFEVEWYVDFGLVKIGPELFPGEYARGEDIYAIVTPTDGTDDGMPVTTDTVVAANSSPFTTLVTWTPAPAFTDSELQVIPDTLDIDGDPFDITLTWYVNGTEVDSGIGLDTLSGDAFVKGDEITVDIVGNDGADGPLFTTDPFVISNTLPTADALEVALDDPYTGGDATCAPSGWTDPDEDDVEGYQFAWTVDGAEVAGEITDTLARSFFAVGSEVGCTATPDDGQDLGTPLSATVVIPNAQPTIEEVTVDVIREGAVVPDVNPREGDELVATVVGLDDVDPSDDASVLTSSIEWFVDGTFVANGDTLTSADFDKGQVIVARATPADDEMDGVPTDSADILPENTPPAITEVLLGPDPAFTTSTITATTTVVDPDPADSPTLSHTWFVNGSEVADHDADTLGPDAFVKTDSVFAVVTADDGEATTDPATSSALVISNTAPSQPLVEVTPEWPMSAQDDLHCAIVEPSLDDDGDTVTYEMTWTVDGTPVRPGDTTATIWPGDTVPEVLVGVDENWTCTATPFDVTDAGSSDTDSVFAQILDLRSISAADDYSCAIDLDGTVRCWGYNDEGETQAPDLVATQVSSGLNSSCAIDETGGLQCWGAQAGITNPPSPADPGDTYTSLDVATSHACAVLASGDIDCWGTNNFGETGVVDVAVPYVEVTTGLIHTCALTDAGEAVCWGANNGGQLDIPEASFITLSASAFATCGIDTDNQITCWGGQPDIVDDAPGGQFVDLDLGPAEACATRVNGSVECWGATFANETPPAGSYIHISVGSFHACGLQEDGTAVCWGDPDALFAFPPTVDFAAVGVGETSLCGLTDTGLVECAGTLSTTDLLPPDLSADPVLDVTMGLDFACAEGLTGSITCWGPDIAAVNDAPTGANFTGLAAGDSHVCALDGTDELVCWGDDSAGQLQAPVKPWVQVSAGDLHTCAIDDLGALSCWGDNSDGETNAPAGTFLQVSTGPNHTCALHDDNTVSCWGNNTFGQTDAPTDNDFIQVLAAERHSCAIRADGTLTCWGDTAAGRATAPGGTFTDIVGAYDYTCGIRTDGDTVCWGLYAY